MKIHKSAFFLFAAGLVLIARLAVVNDFEISLPSSPSATPYNRVFDADQTIIPAGGCVTLSWAVPNAVRVILRGSNWPQGTQEGVAPSGSSIVCPSAATHYVPDEPVRYSLMVTYADGYTDTHEIVISYDGVSEAQAIPSATFDPNATPAGIPVTPDATIQAVFQPFENGWMAWRGDTNTIFVLLGDKTLLSFASDMLQPRLDDGILPTPPPGRVQAALPFDSLWQRDMTLRVQIGWPTAPAQTYAARVFGQITYGFGMTLPDGRYLGMNFAGAWFMGGMTGGNWTVSGAPVTFMPPSYSTLTPTLTLTPSLMGTIYQEFEHGFMVGAEDGNCVYVFAFPPDYSDGNILIPREIREVNDLSSDYHYCIEFDILPDNVVNDPAPPGLRNPTGAFGRVWGYYPDVREQLGYATAPEVRYIAALPPYPTAGFTSGSPWDEPVIGLPDRRSLWCGFRAATAGMCRIETAAP